MISFNDSKKVTNFLATDVKNLISSIPQDHNPNDENWIYLLLILRMVQLQDCEDEQLWHEFSGEVLHSNRFFPQSVFFEKIKALSPYATSVITSNTVLYRCREYADDTFYNNEFIIKCFEFIKEELPELDIDSQDFRNNSKFETILSILFAKPGIRERLIERYNIEKEKHDSFWGYDANNSDASPESKTKSMRANPQGISYLYAAEDINTALIEMRPLLGQLYSMASIKIIQDIKIFDFTGNCIRNAAEQPLFNLSILDKMFSKPNYGDPLEYIPTQCLCEFIKLQGFDGIRFHSSLVQNGKNVVLFCVDSNKRKYDVVGSEIYRVENMKIDYERILPFPDEIVKQLSMP